MKQIDLPLYKFYLIEGMTQEDLNELVLERNNLSEEVYRLNNIIKEVREYIVTHKLYCFKYDNEELFEIVTDKKAKDKLLEILDKGDKEK